MTDFARDVLGKRVLVKGLLRSFPLEQDQEMTQIEDVELLPSDEQLPTPDDIRSIMPNLTDGKPSEQYLKERWGGGPKT